MIPLIFEIFRVFGDFQEDSMPVSSNQTCCLSDILKNLSFHYNTILYVSQDFYRMDLNAVSSA